MSLTLYYHPLASFCHKVLIALYENDTAFERRIINLGEPADRAELEAIWPLCRFPVLRDHARKVDVPVLLKAEGGVGIFVGELTLKRNDFKIGEGEWADSFVSNEINIQFRMFAPQR